jgi:hypothetical protein
MRGTRWRVGLVWERRAAGNSLARRVDMFTQLEKLSNDLGGIRPSRHAITRARSTAGENLQVSLQKICRALIHDIDPKKSFANGCRELKHCVPSMVSPSEVFVRVELV